MPKQTKVKVDVEMTDTFGGEANYSWVRRLQFEVDETASDAAIVRRAKKEMGISGVRCKKTDFGDMIELRPVGSCIVVFVSFPE